MKKLNRSLLKHIGGGGRVGYADCMDGACPPPLIPRKTGYCDGGICYYDDNTNPGGGGCIEPARDCMQWEVGCGCVYS